MSTNQSHKLEHPHDLARRILQQVIDQYGWQPQWDAQKESEALLSFTHSQPALLEQMMKRAATRRYCALWYVACCSENRSKQRDAFCALHTYMFRIACYLAVSKYHLSRDYAEQFAADCTQTAIVIVWQKLNEIREQGSFLGYVKQILLREMLQNLKKEGRMDSLDREDAPEIEQAAPSAEIEPEEAQMEKPSPIEEAIRRCLRSKEQQQVVIENFLRNKTLQQIADLLGKKSNNIRVLKHRALDRLRECKEMNKLLNDQNQQKRDIPLDAEPVRYLHQAIAESQDTAMSCAIVETWLPSFVDDELTGEIVTSKYPDIKRHLDLCSNCERIYTEMIELALDEAEGEIPIPTSTPQPNFSFLPPLPSFVTLARTLVNQVAQEALSVFSPNALMNLPMLGNLFFQRVEALGGQLPAYRAPAAALGLHEDPSTAVLITLSAAYLTTRQVAATFSAQELREQIMQGTLYNTLEQRALRIAQENGMGATEAQTFAQIYADEAQRIPDVWLTLVESARS